MCSQIGRQTTTCQIECRRSYCTRCTVPSSMPGFIVQQSKRNKSSKEYDMDTVNYGLALAKLVSYIEDTHIDDLVAPVFTLTNLANLYSTRLKQIWYKSNRTHPLHKAQKQNIGLLSRHRSPWARPRYGP